MRLAPALLVATLLASPAAARPLWREVPAEPQTPMTRGGPDASLDPSARFRVYETDLDRWAATLTPANFENASGGVEIPLPMPDGRIVALRAMESPVLSAALQHAHPELRTYRVLGPAGSGLSGRLDLTPLGLHAFLRTSEGTVLLAPESRTTTTRMRSYWAKDAASGPFECTEPAIPAMSAPTGPRRSFDSGGDQLRTFRLILMATGEYSQAMGGVQQALAQMTISANRVNAIFEGEVAIHFDVVQMMAFPDPATDPYYSNSRGELVTKNQVVVDSLFGSDSYDDTVVLSITTDYAGVSIRPSFCLGVSQGYSCTTGPDPTTDRYTMRVIAHELGHDMGATHTQDGASRTAATACEPAEGWTIMSAPGNAASFSEGHFHGMSLAQMDTILLGPDSTCGVHVPSGNLLPIANAGPDYTIPQNTPFVLAGSGSDPDAGDVLGYTWDEVDVSPTSNDLTNGPLFRWRPPTAAPTRAFPAFATVLGGVPDPLEKLPAVNRLMHFRLVARDNHPGSGAHAWDEMTITVSGAPFVLTSPNGGNTLTAGVPFNVTWTVGGGSVAPTVDLLISTDGGASWSPLVLGTPNDGAQSVSFVTGTTRTHCRVKVEAVGNLFYDVSNAEFTMVGDPTATLLSLLEAESTAQGIMIRWRLAATFDAVTVERAEAAEGPWMTLAGTPQIEADVVTLLDRDAEPGREYFYRLRAVAGDGATTLFGPIAARGGEAVARLAFVSIAPNPTSGALRVDYALPRTAPVRLRLLDLQGRRVATLVDELQRAGRHQAAWAAGPEGAPPPGVYFLRLESGHSTITRRLIIEH